MRLSLTIAAATCFSLGACSDETVAPPPAPPVNWASLERAPARDAGSVEATASERRVAEVYAAALGGQGFATLGPHLDDDARLLFPGIDDVHGREAVVRAHELLLGAFDDRVVAASRIWRTASEQTIEWTMTATHARDWMKVPATHKPVTLRGLALLWTRDDGSITDVHLYFDVAAVKAQLGVAFEATPSRKAGLKDSGAGMTTTPAFASNMATDAGAGAPQIFDQASSPDEKAGVALGHAALDALEGSSDAAYANTMADDVEIFTLARPQPSRGKADVVAYFKAMHKAIGQLDTTVTDAWGIGPFAVLEYTIAGEQLGPIGWIPAQRDKAIRLHVVDVIEVRAGKIQRVWRFDNPSEVLATSPG